MMNFGEIPREYADYLTSPVVILPVAYDKTSTWIKGSDKGPQAILDASANMELYDIDTDSEVYRLGIHTVDILHSEDSPEKLTDKVFGKVMKYAGDDKFVVTLGGNHTVSIGAVRAFAEKYNDLTVLQFDAHTDLRQEYEGSPYNHACVMARARELCPVIQVGIRSMSIEEKEFMNPDRTVFAGDILSGKKWEQKVLNNLTKNVYITIDLDVFDPAVMPSTGTPEPGGLWYDQVLDMIRMVIDRSNVVAFDIVELCPNEQNKAPDFLAAKLLYQILSERFKNRIPEH
jgi:agmatinase